MVEGYMDLISLYQFGIKNVVATFLRHCIYP
ncbi:MAG: toprim domain-containing protein [Oligoflexia bacterium]|nr:toprim domain-containing protein [Oligoflexia bacterium]